MFRIISDGISGLLEHEYIDRFDQAANIGSGSYGGDRYIDHELHWGKRSDGAWTLENQEGTAVWIDNADELIIRD